MWEDGRERRDGASRTRIYVDVDWGDVGGEEMAAIQNITHLLSVTDEVVSEGLYVRSIYTYRVYIKYIYICVCSLFIDGWTVVIKILGYDRTRVTK